jgi:hypothetical protein
MMMLEVEDRQPDRVITIWIFQKKLRYIGGGGCENPNLVKIKYTQSIETN